MVKTSTLQRVWLNQSEVAITGRSAETVRASYLDNIPLGRFCEPEDAGALVAWLAGEGASYNRSSEKGDSAMPKDDATKTK